MSYHRSMRWTPVAIGIAFALPAYAHAPTSIDMVEHIFGASNTNAALGHGALTAGVSADGDLTVLSWPSPSFADQLAYVASNDLDVRSRPRMGAAAGMGSFVGLLVGTELVWLRDLPHTQRYTRPDAPVAETTFTRQDFTVVLTDIISPDADVLTRRVVVTRAQGAPVTSVVLVVYENLSPTLSKIPMVPFADSLLDSRNDFLAFWDDNAKAIVHVHPSDRAVIRGLFDLVETPESVSYGPADALMRQATPDSAQVGALASDIDAAFPSGVAALATTDPPPSQFQVGSDATPVCESVGHVADNLRALPAAFPGLKLPIDSSVADALRCTDPLPVVRTAHKWQWAPQDALTLPMERCRARASPRVRPMGR